MRNRQFESELPGILTSFPKLKIVELESEQYVTGEIDIVDASGRLWDTYSVEIKANEDFPNRFPKLFETGDAFPKNMDWHVYPEDDSCCVDIPHNEIILCQNGISLLEYLNEHAVPYFANQSFRRREGYYLYGEYSHGLWGKLEYYQNKLKAKSFLELLRMLELIVKDFNPDRTAFCPFCRKQKFRNCHRKSFIELSVIKGYVISDMNEQLIPLYKKFPDFKLPDVF